MLTAFTDTTKVYDIATFPGYNLSSSTIQYLCSSQRNFRVIPTVFLSKASIASHDM